MYDQSRLGSFGNRYYNNLSQGEIGGKRISRHLSNFRPDRLRIPANYPTICPKIETFGESLRFYLGADVTFRMRLSIGQRAGLETSLHSMRTRLVRHRA